MNNRKEMFIAGSNPASRSINESYCVMNITGLDQDEFKFKYRTQGSEIIVRGRISYDYDKNKHKASITQGSADIHVYDEDGATAAAKAILKWL